MPVGPPGAPEAGVKPFTRATQSWTRLWHGVLRDAPRDLKRARRYGQAMRRAR